MWICFCPAAEGWRWTQNHGHCLSSTSLLVPMEIAWSAMLRTREHLGGCFMDSNAFFFLWMLEFEQPIEGRWLNFSHRSAPGRWKPSFGLGFVLSSLRLTSCQFAMPQALCESFVILMPPISLSHVHSLTISYCPNKWATWVRLKGMAAHQEHS